MRYLILFLIIAITFSSKADEVFNYQSINPDINGIVDNGNGNPIFYGTNGILQLNNHEKYKTKIINFSNNIIKIFNRNDSLIGIDSYGSLIISTNKGESWFNINNKVKLSNIINFLITDNYYIISELNKVHLFDKNLVLVKTLDSLYVNNSSSIGLFNDTLFYYKFLEPNLSRMLYVPLNFGDENLNPKVYCNYCDLRSIHHFVSSPNKKLITRDNELIEFNQAWDSTKGEYEQSLYKKLYISGSKKSQFIKVIRDGYLVVEKHQFSKVANQVKLKLIFLDKDGLVLDSFYTPTYVKGYSTLFVENVLAIEEIGEYIYITDKYNLKIKIKKKKDIEFISNYGILKNSLLVDSTLFTFTFRNLIDEFNINTIETSKVITFSDFSDSNLISNSVDKSILLYNEFSKKLEVFCIPSNKGQSTFVYTLDTGKTFQKSNYNLFKFSSIDFNNAIYFDLIKHSDSSYFFTGHPFYGKFSLINYNLKNEPLLLDTFLHSMQSLKLFGDYIYSFNVPNYYTYFRNITRYNIVTKTTDTLVKLNYKINHSNCYFLNTDSAIVVLHDSTDKNPLTYYKVILIDLQKGTEKLLDSGYGLVRPNDFFFTKSGQRFICGFNYLYDIDKKQSYSYSDNRNYIPRKNIYGELQTMGISVNYGNTYDFILTPKSTTSIESPQIEESAYLYTYPPRPNPATQSVSAEVYWNSAYTLSESNVSVYDIYGSKYNSNITFTSKEPFRAIINADCTNLATGIYFIRISVNGEYKTIPFTVVK